MLKNIVIIIVIDNSNNNSNHGKLLSVASAFIFLASKNCDQYISL